jgi:hypothetical protein
MRQLNKVQPMQITSNKGKVVSKMPILKSRDVDQSYEHKLWWVDIEERTDGRFCVVTYAQLFSVQDRKITGEQVRRYETDVQATLDRAEDCARTRYKQKQTSAKGYEHFKDRDETSDLDFDIGIINTFLKKYGGTIS